MNGPITAETVEQGTGRVNVLLLDRRMPTVQARGHGLTPRTLRFPEMAQRHEEGFRGSLSEPFT